MPTPKNLVRVAAATLCLINRQRTSRGRAPLHANAALRTAAAGHSLDMVARDYFDHVSPSGADPLVRLRATGYVRPNAAFRIGENIAAATGALATPAATVGRWMNSPGHRANILTAAYRDTGIGIAPAIPAAVGTGPGATYTQDFGTVA